MRRKSNALLAAQAYQLFYKNTSLLPIKSKVQKNVLASEGDFWLVRRIASCIPAKNNKASCACKQHWFDCIAKPMPLK
jgi:hypothetical protein